MRKRITALLSLLGMTVPLNAALPPGQAQPTPQSSAKTRAQQEAGKLNKAQEIDKLNKAQAAGKFDKAQAASKLNESKTSPAGAQQQH